MSGTARLPEGIAYRRGRLFVEGVSIERVVRRTGTPVYIYSAGGILGRFQRLKRAFSGLKPLICYALKANSNLAVCRLLARAGAGADVVSGGELLRALRAGFPARDIVFSGVGKTGEELGLALRRGVRALNVESAEELAALSRAARRCRRIAPVAVRVNPDIDAGAHRHISTGRVKDKFGVDVRAAFELYRRAAADARLAPVGLQCHIGSQITRIAPYRRALRTLTGLVRRLGAARIRLDHVDIGGGMGVVYDKERPFSPEALAWAAKEELRDYPGLRLLLEPGRYLVGEAGILATNVLYRKSSGRKRFVIVDAAMTDLLRPALYDAYHGIVPVLRSRGRKTAVDVVGPVCETADTFAVNRPLPDTSAGDLLAILQAGAYGFCMSSHYNSRPRAAEVLVTGAEFRIVRRRETLADIIRHERG